jgi:hypothetical protein
MTEVCTRTRGRHAADSSARTEAANGAAAAPEAVVARGVDRVEADRDAAHPALDHARRDGVGEQDAVGPHDHPHSDRRRGSGDVVHVAPEQRLAAGEDHHLGAQCAELAEHGETLLRRQLVGGGLARLHVAVRTAQVAALRQVPGDEGGAAGRHHR